VINARSVIYLMPIWHELGRALLLAFSQLSERLRTFEG
jgi:hypothetical protein